MLGLREEVGGDPGGVGTGVGKDENFARPRQQIDGDVAEDLALGLDDIRVAPGRIFSAPA